MPNKEALKEIRQAISEIAVSNDTNLGPVEVYRPRSIRERMADEKARLEEHNRERIARLAQLRKSVVRS
jgi:hypothetical protein